MRSTGYPRRLVATYDKKFDRNLEDVVNKQGDMQEKHTLSNHRGDNYIHCKVFGEHGKIPNPDNIQFCPFCGWEIGYV